MAAMRLRFGRNPPRTPMLVVSAVGRRSRCGDAPHDRYRDHYWDLQLRDVCLISHGSRHDQVPTDSAPGRAEVRSCDKTSRSVLQKSSAARMSPLTDYTTRGRCRRARSRVPARVSVAAWLLCGVMLGWAARHMSPGVYFGRHTPIREGFSRNRLVDARGGCDSHIFLSGV
jgi:hypothetical protein